MYQRWQESLLKQALETRRVLLLTGPRQCGKTTLTKTLMHHDAVYRTLDDQDMLDAAKLDPQGFVKLPGKPMVIDEVQLVPELFRAIKKVVDEDTRPGQYLLTGSTNIQSLPGVQESLAGRIRKIRLRPLTQGELLGIPPTFLNRAFEQRWDKTFNEPDDRDSILQKAFAGGFPEALLLDDRQRRQWHKDYFEALMDRDLREIVNIRRYDAMQELFRALAAWSSKFMDLSAIGSGLGLQRTTLESYINALEALYLIERVPSWTRTDYGRVSKQPKVFMTDTGLMSSLLGWRHDQVRLDADRSGKLLETFIFQELAAQVDASGGVYSLYHYRDREKREIDFLIEREDGAFVGIEVKAGSTVGADTFKHLHWFKTNLAKERPFIGIVLYTGSIPFTYTENLWAIPIQQLWNSF